ncbi:unnamed protein product [Staurois parvus]|uniref:PHD-type domain-containing protein n=1 Tax=Staurois parvus TaxID=386267 RepID=A0ABN9B397_9NEOB|nr:unnamed protein product [Staurois parvus]
MAKTSEQMCAFCGKKAGGDVGGLHNTTDNSILAHYDCLIFSPQVITTESDDEPEFDISSVLAEIKRGKKMKCSYCKQPGATIGCDIKRCHKHTIMYVWKKTKELETASDMSSIVRNIKI